MSEYQEMSLERVGDLFNDLQDFLNEEEEERGRTINAETVLRALARRIEELREKEAF